MKRVCLLVFMAAITFAGGFAYSQERQYDIKDYPFGDIFFGPHSDRLDAEAKAKLDELYGWLKERPAFVVLLAGYDDQQTPREQSIELGRQRADAVRDYLVSKGVDPAKVKSISFGNTRLADTGTGERALAHNRRVRYRVMPMEDPTLMEGKPSGVCQRCKM